MTGEWRSDLYDRFHDEGPLDDDPMADEYRTTEESSHASLIGLFDPVVEDTCRVCGCSDYDACVDVDRGPCGWAAPGLCNSHRVRDLAWALWQLLVGRLRWCR